MGKLPTIKPSLKINLIRNKVHPVLDLNSEITGLKKGYKIGEGRFGQVYRGTAIVNGVRKPVAIKEFRLDRGFKDIKTAFRENHLEFSVEAVALRYNRLFSDLKKAGVRITPMKVIVYNGRLYVISLLFIKNDVSQLDYYPAEHYSPEKKELFAKDYANIINAGYIPKSDVFLDRAEYEIMAFDFDLPMLHKMYEEHHGKEYFYNQIWNQLSFLEGSTGLNREFGLGILKYIKDPKVKKIIRELLNAKSQ